MLIALLLGNLVLSVLVAFFVTRIFKPPIASILSRIIKEDISVAWVKYIMFAQYVAGISTGVRVWELEQYILGSPAKEAAIPVLSADRLVFECYKTLIGTLQGISGVLLAFFVVTIIAYAIIRAVESRKGKTGTESAGQS